MNLAFAKAHCLKKQSASVQQQQFQVQPTSVKSERGKNTIFQEQNENVLMDTRK